MRVNCLWPLLVAGQTVYHYFGKTAFVELTSGTWMVEYGRELVPFLRVYFLIMDTFTLKLDFVEIYNILSVYSTAWYMEEEYMQTGGLIKYFY